MRDVAGDVQPAVHRGVSGGGGQAGGAEHEQPDQPDPAAGRPPLPGGVAHLAPRTVRQLLLPPHPLPRALRQPGEPGVRHLHLPRQVHRRRQRGAGGAADRGGDVTHQ